MILTQHPYRFCPRARLLRLGEIFAVAAVVWTGAMALLASLHAAAGLFAAASAIAAGLVGVSYARCSCTTYELTSDMLIVQCGIFLKMRDVVPYKKIERVALVQSRLGALLGACELRVRPAPSVTVDTAGVGPEEQAEELSCLRRSREYALLMSTPRAQEAAAFIRERIEDLRRQEEERAARR